MKPKQVKNLLLSEINRISLNSKTYCVNPQTDFTRARKLPFKHLLKSIIGMESGTLTNELLDTFNFSSNAASASAFVQQRCKIKPEAFEDIFKGFSKHISAGFKEDMRILAIDGSDIQIATNPDDPGSYFQGSNGQKPYNLLHLNALYDLNHHIYSDAIIQKRKEGSEYGALADMVDRSDIPKALVIADRGYESYNIMAHIQEKGWKFLIRIRDGKSSIKSTLELPQQESFDFFVCLNLTRKQSNETKNLFADKNHYKFLPASSPFDYLPARNKHKEPAIFYELKFRVVRFKVSDDCYETILTNLEQEQYPLEKVKQLYALRWKIETSFRDLKYTIGMLKFHSKKVMCIQQEIHAHLIMYNFAEMITSHVVIEKKQRKYTYKANFVVAVHMCRLFYQGNTTSPNLEAVIARNLIPIRPGRHRERKSTVKVFQGFHY